MEMSALHAQFLPWNKKSSICFADVTTALKFPKVVTENWDNVYMNSVHNLAGKSVNFCKSAIGK